MKNLDMRAAVDLATNMYTSEYLRSEYADNRNHELILEEECRKNGTSIEELDDCRSSAENNELDTAIEKLPGYDPYEDIMKIIQSDSQTMSIDKAMGIDEGVEDDDIVKELTAALAE